MIAIAAYMLKAILVSGVFCGYYQLFLKNKPFHAFNRFYILSVIVVSCVIPLVHWEWPSATFESSPLLALAQKAGTGVETFSGNYIATGLWVAIGYAFISLTILSILISKILWIYKIKQASPCTPSEGFTLIETSVKGAPFSFLDNLFWKQGLSLTDDNGQKVFRHELTHIQQGHTHDRLLVQMVSSLFWCNPFYWLLQKELVTVHEFIADRAAVSDGDTEAFASMLLYTHNNGSYLSPSHHFFNSQIKRRLTMISSSKSARYAGLRKALVVPVAFAIIFALSLVSKAQTAPPSATAVVPVTGDTLPKKTGEPITVTGYSLKKKAKPATPPASQESLKPVTVNGKKLEKKDAPKKEVKKSF